MRLLRVGPPGGERPAVLVTDTTYVDVSDMVRDYDAEFFETGGVNDLRAVVGERVAADSVQDLAGQRVGPPVARPHQILCIGLNYRDHAAETGQAVPEEPIVFTKSPNTLVGPTTTLCSRAAPPRPTGRWSWRSSSASRCSYLTDREAAHRPRSLDMPSVTT